MHIKETANGWEIIPQTKDEETRLRWLIDSLKSHPDQQPRASNADGSSSATANQS